MLGRRDHAARPAPTKLEPDDRHQDVHRGGDAVGDLQREAEVNHGEQARDRGDHEERGSQLRHGTIMSGRAAQVGLPAMPAAPGQAAPTRVVVADDDTLVREGVKGLLASPTLSP